MPRRKRRIDRKLHKWYLDLGVIDLSWAGPWRQWLMAAPLYQPFIINSRHLEGLSARTAYGVRRYGLSYTVYRVPQNESPYVEPEWYGYDDFAFFRFQATRYPDIYSVTANNPEC